MIRTITLITALAFFLCNQSVAHARQAQAAPVVSARILETVRVYEVDWQIEENIHVPYIDALKYELLFFRWLRNHSYIDAFVFIHPSEEDAASTFKLIAHEGSAFGRHKRFYVSGAQDLGQQSYYWKGFGDAKGDYGYIFIKDRAVISISGPSPKTAKRFALHITSKL